ncbi:MAG: transcription antitermination factor NusB [Desulfobacterales bacterium]|uniref:Transcription antitermination protein NusB n=1 Tax=Candidatus Desulfaltia bathyphila TaxID=2841697 RepID=A0A8J6N8W3_9BACT|nr:transcription antitermination factor NusB [Candidatus Desulfaltia bathyphila]MBL7194913.1 transcription antitermination factor NusB [Desulfobacterales bacterium]MBL7207266.1 transcription antitermination factor NusB [Desulfobacterales bacterium]
MGIRRRSRELAVQALFYMDISKNDSQETVELFCDNFVHSKNAIPFFLELVNGVIDNRSEIDSIIERFSSHWKIGRMACVDRNIMRIAVYELLFCNDIPAKVSINEAIDIGKKFGTEESGAFINGILDSVSIALEKEKINIEVKANKTN